MKPFDGLLASAASEKVFRPLINIVEHISPYIHYITDSFVISLLFFSMTCIWSGGQQQQMVYLHRNKKKR